MSYVITDPCVSTCDTACASVCPTDAIHGPKSAEELAELPQAKRTLFVLGAQLVIDPANCIDCGMCEPECPVDAIFVDDRVPAKWAASIARNEAFFV